MQVHSVALLRIIFNTFVLTLAGRAKQPSGRRQSRTVRSLLGILERAASNLNPNDASSVSSKAVDSVCTAVHPGCTNRGVSVLLRQRTSADHGILVGWRQRWRWPKTKGAWKRLPQRNYYR